MMSLVWKGLRLITNPVTVNAGVYSNCLGGGGGGGDFYSHLNGADCTWYLQSWGIIRLPVSDA